MKKQNKKDSEILALMMKMQEQIAGLDKKVDSLVDCMVSRIKTLPDTIKPPAAAAVSAAPSATFAQRPVHLNIQAGQSPRDFNKGRPTYRAVCADCKKECEIPFKPSGDRPVYCKECFALRKKNNALRPPAVNRPVLGPVPGSVQAPVPAPVSPPVNSPAAVLEKVKEKAVKGKKKPAAQKKPAKKKAVFKKKKK